MAEQRGRIQPQIHGFRGMNRKANFLNIPNNYVVLALNCNNDVLGALSGRPGYTAFLNAPEATPVRNLFGWKKPNGDHRLFMVANGNLYEYDWVAANWGSDIHSGFEDVPLAKAILNGKVFLSDGVNTPVTYDGTTVADVVDAAVPKPTAAITWKDRVYTNDTSARSQLFYSKRLDPTNWTPDPTDVDVDAANFVSIDEDNGFDIVGFSVDAQGNLIVHKENGLYKVVPDNFGRPYEVYPLATIGGATTKTAIAQGERAGFYFNRRGFFLYGTDQAQKTSRFIDDLVKGIDSTNYSSIATEFFDERFYSSVGTITLGDEVFTNSVLVYDNDTNDYFLYTFAHLPTCWGRVVDDVGAERFFFGASNGQIYEFGVGTDDAGKDIEMRIVSKAYHFNAAITRKSGYRLVAIHNPGMVATLRYRLDYPDEKADIKEIADLAPSGVTIAEFEEGATGFSLFSFEVANAFSGEKPILYGVELDLATEGVG